MSVQIIELPPPRYDGASSVEAALRERCSVREYTDEPLTLAEISQLLWAAQGVTHGSGRTAPSAGALFPLEVYVVAVRVDGLAPGLYKYRIGDHELLELARENVHPDLTAAALSQECVRDAAAVIAIGAVVERTATKYGGRAERYVDMEVGAAAQNVSLQVAALGLGAVFVGAFNDARLKKLLCMGKREAALALLPVGRPRVA
ncbi:MAG: SagB/ThcOx family dehydrogenase [Gemmatimonadota bacterium]|nr:MAG: SagB/ThcOx family dehydrogenase [Gemmatimonadota bacterium]